MYRYEDYRPWILSDEGQRALIKARDQIMKRLDQNGAVRFQEGTAGFDVCDSWRQIAIFDRLVEIGDLTCITNGVATQHRVYIRNND